MYGSGAGNPARSRLSGGFRRLKAGGSQDWLPHVTSQIAIPASSTTPLSFENTPTPAAAISPASHATPPPPPGAPPPPARPPPPGPPRGRPPPRVATQPRQHPETGQQVRAPHDVGDRFREHGMQRPDRGQGPCGPRSEEHTSE